MFTVSSQVRYALRALQYIANHGNGGYVPLSKIAEDESISRKYLESIFTSLKKGGLVRSVRGPEGGYTLTRSPGDISLWDVITAAEGTIRTAECIDSPEFCEKHAECGTKDIWRELQKHIEGFLRKRTIQSGGADDLHGQ